MTDALYAHLLSVYWLFLGAGALIILVMWAAVAACFRRVTGVHVPTNIGEI